MARLTIYVPDELAEEVRQTDALNVSQVCQRALEAEVRKRSEGEAVGAFPGLFTGIEREFAKFQRELPKLQEAIQRALPSPEQVELLTTAVHDAATIPEPQRRELTKALQAYRQGMFLPKGGGGGA